MKEEKTEIKKIVLTIEGKEISLSPEGAEKLRNILCELFGKEVIVKEKVVHEYRGWPVYYYQPLIPWNTSPIYCTSTQVADSAVTFTADATTCGGTLAITC